MSVLSILKIIATALQINFSTIAGICWVESNHRNVLNKDDGGSPSYGICQIKLATAHMFNNKLKAEDLMIPAVNIYYASRYFKYQTKRYRKHKFPDYCAISAYNAGSCRSNKGYVKKVRKARKRFKWHYLSYY